MGLFNSRSAAAASSWLLLSLALLILHVQAQRRYIPRRHHIRRISHPNSKIQSASSSLLHPISVPLLPGPILKIPPPPKKFAYATFAPIPSAAEAADDPLNGFIQLVLAKQPLYPPAPYQKPTEPPTTAAPATEVPTTVPPPTTVKPKTTAKTYVRPPPTEKAIIPKIVKPTKNPLNIISKVTKATPAPTSSAAPLPVVPVLDPIVDVRVVGGEMMKLGVTKTQEPVSSPVPAVSAVTAPATIPTSAPSTVPPATIAPASISIEDPATESVPIETEAPEELLKVNTPEPLSFASFSPYQRPFYRPAIYTRPPFRPHLQYTLLPKSTEATGPSEIAKLNVDARLSVPTTTEVEPEIVTVKEDVPEPAPFDDYEMFKVLPDDSEENSILAIDEEPNLSESTELPPVLPEEPVIFKALEEPIVVEDDSKANELHPVLPEEPVIFKDPEEPVVVEDDSKANELPPVLPEEPVIFADPEEPIVVEDDSKANEIIETVPEEPKILEVIPNEPEILEVIPEEPTILEVIPNEPTILEVIPDEPIILESIPDEPEIIESIPAELAVLDIVSDEPKSVEIIPEVPAIIEDVPKELEVIDPELVEPQIFEAEKKLPVDIKEPAFEFTIPETSNDIQLSIEETKIGEEDFERGPIFEVVTKAVPVVADEFKIIQEVSKPDLLVPKSPETFKVIEPIPALEEDIVEESPIVPLPDVKEIVTTVESQPFKRSHKYEPVWNIHTFSHGDKHSPPRSQSFPGWPELSSTTRKSHDYPTWLQSTTSSPFARNIPDWPQHVTTHRGYVFSKWSPKFENDKKSTTEKPFSPETKTIESTTEKYSEEIPRLNHLKNVRKSRRRFRTSTIKPTTRRGTLPKVSTFIKSTTVKTPVRSTIFPTWDDIQTRKASRERTSSESRETNSGLNTGFGTGVGTGFGFGDWGSKI